MCLSSCLNIKCVYAEKMRIASASIIIFRTQPTRKPTNSHTNFNKILFYCQTLCYFLSNQLTVYGDRYLLYVT